MDRECRNWRDNEHLLVVELEAGEIGVCISTPPQPRLRLRVYTLGR